MAVSKILTSSTDIKKEWLEQIAPKYFDLDNVNMYQAGTFGFTLEMMSTMSEDSRQAAGFARREFYPTTAKNTASLYKMAALQRIDLPMATPATVRAILILEEKTVTSKGIVEGDIVKFVIDGNTQFIVDKLSFMLDYPVVILAKRIKGTWTFVTHYDVSKSNSLNKSYNKYLKNTIIKREGERILCIEVELHQVSVISVTEPITKNANIDIVTMDFKFSGMIANFEAFYKESEAKNEVQLLKVLKNSLVPQSPFCMYTLVKNDTLRIHFPSNIYFTPRFNSLLTVNIYITEGEEGNFDTFEGSLACEVKSEEYPYSNGIFLSGLTKGSAWGGSNLPDQSDFKRKILYAYATNDTITTENDLQIFFDMKNEDTNTRIIFFKRRDDVFERRYGAFFLMKDKESNIVPTNTLSIRLPELDYDAIYEPTSTCILRPGKIFRYLSQSKDIVVINKDLILSDDLNPYDAANNFLYTNPFLIVATKYPSTIGYYLNSVDKIIPLEYDEVNDNSFFQFLVNNLHVYRNAIIGQNFYKLSITITPSSIQPDFQYTVFDEVDDNNSDNYIRAAEDGKVTLIKYINNAVYATIKYISGVEQRIQMSSYVSKNTNEQKFEYHDGWIFDYKVGDTFQKNDIIAKKMIHDRGKLRIIGVIKGAFDSYERYFPYVLESFNDETNHYTFSAYLSTEDLISTNEYLEIDHGVCNKTGTEVVGGALINFENTKIDSYVFYEYDDKNYTHRFSEYAYVAKYTMTNSYSHDENDPFDMITPLRYIRSTLLMEPLEEAVIKSDPVFSQDAIPDGVQNKTYVVKDKNSIPEELYTVTRTIISGGIGLRHTISEVPLVRSNWIKNDANSSYFINKIMNTYLFLQDAYRVLENTFTIDMKFTNTYGYSKFTNVGIKDQMRTLDRVNLTLRLGVHLNILSSFENFRTRFVAFVKNYIEDVNTTSHEGKQIYMMNLVAACKMEFEEIEYMEYYGVNEYDKDDVQKIDSLGSDAIHDLGYQEYIPEFVNIYSLTEEDGTNSPQIDVYLIE